MPIKKSAIKKARQDEVRKSKNRLIKINFRSKIKALKETLASATTKDTSKELSEAYSALDKAAKKGVIHRNSAARKKARLAKAIAKSGDAPKNEKPKAKKTKKTA